MLSAFDSHGVCSELWCCSGHAIVPIVSESSCVCCRVPNIVYVLEALTPKACQEDYSYERLELLGDAFLKFAVSLFLFLTFPEAHEGTN